METKKIKITGEYITLGQLLKFVNIVDSGSLAKGYLLTNEVLVNGVPDNRRGRKIRSGDKVETGSYRIEIL